MYGCGGCCLGSSAGDVVRGTLRSLFGERKAGFCCDVSFSTIWEGLILRDSTSSDRKNGSSLSSGINGSVYLRVYQSAESRTSILNQCEHVTYDMGNGSTALSQGECM